MKFGVSSLLEFLFSFFSNFLLLFFGQLFPTAFEEGLLVLVVSSVDSSLKLVGDVDLGRVLSSEGPDAGNEMKKCQ